MNLTSVLVAVALFAQAGEQKEQWVVELKDPLDLAAIGSALGPGRVVDICRANQRIVLLESGRDTSLPMFLSMMPAEHAGIQKNGFSRPLGGSLPQASDQQWHLDALHVKEVWTRHTTGDPHLIIAVIDSGVDRIDDLVENVGNPKERWGGRWRFPGRGHRDQKDGLDNDGNGFVDDLYGWNVVDNSTITRDVLASDGGHGTNIAGVIAASAQVPVGVGVMWRAAILPVMVAQKKEFSDYHTICGIEYALRSRARIINASWGEVREENPLLGDAIKRARDAGVLFVTAGGNEGINIDLPGKRFLPGGFARDPEFTNVLSVTGTDRDGAFIHGLNYGPGSLSVTAPGIDIFGPQPGGQFAGSVGTSISAACVTGVAGLLLSKDPSLDAPAAVMRLVRSSSRAPALHLASRSHGRVSAIRALDDFGPDQDLDTLPWEKLPLSQPIEPKFCGKECSTPYTITATPAAFLRVELDELDTKGGRGEARVWAGNQPVQRIQGKYVRVASMGHAGGVLNLEWVMGAHATPHLKLVATSCSVVWKDRAHRVSQCVVEPND